MSKAFYTLANCDQIKCDGGLIKYWLEFPEWCSSETIDGPIKRKHQLIQVRFPYCNLKSSKTTNGKLSANKSQFADSDRSVRLKNESREEGLSKSAAQKRDSF